MPDLDWEFWLTITQGLGAVIIFGSWIVERTYLADTKAALEKLETDMAGLRSLNVNITTVRAIQIAANQDEQKAIQPLIEQLERQADSIRKGIKGTDIKDFTNRIGPTEWGHILKIPFLSDLLIMMLGIITELANISAEMQKIRDKKKHANRIFMALYIFGTTIVITSTVFKGLVEEST
jgi:hypothetical protein